MYLHDKRAGNFGDVHKHIGLLSVLTAVVSENFYILYIETHSGSGFYESTSDKAEDNGVGRVLTAEDNGVMIKSPDIQAYAKVIRYYRTDTKKRQYPGSPVLAISILGQGAGHEIVLAELQSEVAKELTRTILVDQRSALLKVAVEIGDGYSVLRKSLARLSNEETTHDNETVNDTHRVPLVLIDPPYTDTKADLDEIPKAVVDCLKSSPDAIVLIWYPIKEGNDELLISWKKDLVKAAEDIGTMQEAEPINDSSSSGEASRRQIIFSEIRTRSHGKAATTTSADGQVMAGSGLALLHRFEEMNESMKKWTAELHGILVPEDGRWNILEC